MYAWWVFPISFWRFRVWNVQSYEFQYFDFLLFISKEDEIILFLGYNIKLQWNVSTIFHAYCFNTGPSSAPSNIHASVQEETSLTICWDALNVFTKNGDIKGYKYVVYFFYVSILWNALKIWIFSFVSNISFGRFILCFWLSSTMVMLNNYLS